MTPFKAGNAGKPYAEQIKPMNYLLSPHVKRMDVSTGHDATEFHLIALFEKVPSKVAGEGATDQCSAKTSHVTSQEHVRWRGRR